ncbi:glucuronosyltransferase [Rhizobiaceae bacterium BDR2-2]|uniref:Glucuronosyltransferase n=1 Tax=Ectorhizobium quercum TaxID=2965071 RepID=A0AAE3N4M3_9HYPH|nr:glycosyltransferase [Ectorhizobium quercum]MCX8998432.1 glucuronosyltransferase [Ectorhizobium quercum]
MIVVTVGTQLPFDRLIKAVDDLAVKIPHKVFAQTGKGTYQPRNIEYSATVVAGEFDRMLSECRVIVAHAGIGTVIKALKYKKPIILVPRRAALNEHRNDHQMATVSKLRHRAGIYVAEDEDELFGLLTTDLEAASPETFTTPGRHKLQAFILDEIHKSVV